MLGNWRAVMASKKVFFYDLQKLSLQVSSLDDFFFCYELGKNCKKQWENITCQIEIFLFPPQLLHSGTMHLVPYEGLVLF